MTTASPALLRTVLLLAVALASGLSSGCADSRAAEDSSGTVASPAVADQPLQAFQAELLDIAFKAVTAMPVQPHLKDRSRAQEEVVQACFTLDQPQRALGYIEQIDDWRRGTGYADYAFYCAQHGDTTQVQHHLDLAQQISEQTDAENPQDWQRDRIRAAIARTHLLLGHEAQAQEFASGVVDSEAGAVEALKARRADAEACDEQISKLPGIAATGSFEQVRNALEAAAQLFDRFYADAERRARIRTAMEDASTKLPVKLRIELLLELAGFALDHGDQAQALELASAVRQLIDEGKWLPEDQVPLLARVAALRHGAGDVTAARADADAALALYEAQRDRIVNIDRAGALRPLAEAWQAMGDTRAALAIYRRAVEEGVENPNSRPRAEDLAATCCSMALHGVQPDAELTARIAQIGDALGPPW